MTGYTPKYGSEIKYLPQLFLDSFNASRKFEVQLSDQTSPALFVKASQVTVETTLASPVALDDETITVTDATGIIAGSYLGIFSLTTNRFYVGTVILVASNVLTMDTPIDSDFEVGDTVGVGETNMNVDGSVTPQIFTIRGADPGIDVTVDITRIIISCITDTAVDLTKFGDLTKLTRGLMMRRVDGFTQNIITWKDNGEMAGSMFDWTPYSSTNPNQGVDGFISRLTFAGANKLGVALRIGPGEKLEFHIRDDLSGLLKFEIMVEGHVVAD